MPRVPAGVEGGRILGWGTALPEKIGRASCRERV